MIDKTRILGLVVVLEAIIIIVLAASHYRIVLQPRLTPVMVAESPLELALKYESPDAKFEELIKDDPDSVRYRCPMTDIPILATCALAKKTNYVRILVRHGADVNQAVEALDKVDADEGVRLIREVQLKTTNQKAE